MPISAWTATTSSSPAARRTSARRSPRRSRRAGAKVMICDLQAEKSADTASDIAKETGNEVHGMGCDVTKDEDIQAVVDATVKAFGGISTLINNVGWGGRQPDPAAIPEGRVPEVLQPEHGQRLPDEHGLPALAGEGRERHDHQFRLVLVGRAGLRHPALWHGEGGAEPDDGVAGAHADGQGARQLRPDRDGHHRRAMPMPASRPRCRRS